MIKVGLLTLSTFPIVALIISYNKGTYILTPFGWILYILLFISYAVLFSKLLNQYV